MIFDDKKHPILLEIGHLLDKCEFCKKKGGDKDPYGWYKCCETCPVKENIIEKGKELESVTKSKDTKEEDAKYTIKHQSRGRKKRNDFELEIVIDGVTYRFDKYDEDVMLDFLEKHALKIRRKDLEEVLGLKRYYRLKEKLSKKGLLLGNDLRKEYIRNYIKNNYYKEKAITIMNNLQIGHKTYKKVVEELKTKGLLHE